MDVAYAIVEAARFRLKVETGAWAFSADFQDPFWEAYFRKIPTMFGYFIDRRPEDVDPLIDGLQRLNFQLSSGLMGKVDALEVDLKDWRGAGADAFKDNFLAPFDVIRDNQLQVIQVMILALRGVREIITRTRNDILTLGTQTLDAIKALGEGEQPLFGKGAATGFTVVGAVLAIAGSGGGAALALTVLGSLFSVGTTAGSEFGGSTVGGDNVTEILGTMNDSAQTLLDCIQAEEERLGKGLRNILPTLEHGLTDAKGFALVPLLNRRNEMADPGAFHT
ncbi:hypothetical protein [Actinorhabdospora filicis]|nr:hypothetical protein [Actinorhabdospora filicis]